MNRRILEFLQFQIHTMVAFVERLKTDRGDPGTTPDPLTDTSTHLRRAAHEITKMLDSDGFDHD